MMQLALRDPIHTGRMRLLKEASHCVPTTQLLIVFISGSLLCQTGRG